MGWQTALHSGIRISQPGPLSLEACILAHQWQCQPQKVLSTVSGTVSDSRDVNYYFECPRSF